MRRLFSAFLVAFLIFGSFVFPASAQVVCGDREALIARLTNIIDQIPIFLGITADGEVVELFLSPDGPWTMLVTQPKGFSCVLAIGKNGLKIQKLVSEPEA